MSYLILTIKEIATLVAARDICGLHALPNSDAEAAHNSLLAVLKNSALELEK